MRIITPVVAALLLGGAAAYVALGRQNTSKAAPRQSVVQVMPLLGKPIAQWKVRFGKPLSVEDVEKDLPPGWPAKYYAFKAQSLSLRVGALKSGVVTHCSVSFKDGPADFESEAAMLGLPKSISIQKQGSWVPGNDGKPVAYYHRIIGLSLPTGWIAKWIGGGSRFGEIVLEKQGQSPQP